MYPILGRYGPFFLFSYTVALGTGIGAGIGLAVWWARRRNVAADWLDGLLAALVVGLVGGRAGFVWHEWAYFGERPSQILQFQQGGLSYHGALLAGLVGLWGWHVWRKRPFLSTADLLAPSMALVSAFGWLACWLEGCAYGREAASSSWLAADLPDTFGVYAWRYQTQLLGVGPSLLIFTLILLFSRRWPPGWTFWVTVFALSLSRVAISLLRGDPARQIGAVRLDTLLDVLFAIFSLLLLKYTSSRNAITSGRDDYEARRLRDH